MAAGAESAPPCKRKEDARFLTGRGNYTDDIDRPRPDLHAGRPLAARPRAHPAHRHRRGPRRARRGRRVHRRGHRRREVGSIPCGWLINNKDGTPMVEPPHPALVRGPGAPRRRPGRHRHRRDQDQAREAAELVEVDYEALPAVATSPRRRRPGAPPGLGAGRGATSATTGTSATRRAVDAAFAKADKVVEDRPRQQPAHPQRHGAARRHRRVTTRDRRHHALHHQPEPAPDRGCSSAPSASASPSTSSGSSRPTSAAASAPRSSTTRRRSWSSGRPASWDGR